MGVLQSFRLLSDPFIYFFIWSLIKNEHKIRWWYFIHFLPFGFNFIELKSLSSGINEIKMQKIQPIISYYWEDYNFYYNGFMNSLWHSVLSNMSLLLYLLASSVIYFKYKINYTPQSSIDYRSKIGFVSLFLFSNFLFCIFNLSESFIKMDATYELFEIVFNSFFICKISRLVDS